MSTESSNSSGNPQAIKKKPVSKSVQQPTLNKSHDQDIVLTNSSEPLKKSSSVTSAVKKSVPISPSANSSHSQSSKSNKITPSTKTPGHEKPVDSFSRTPVSNSQLGASSANASIKRQNSTSVNRTVSSSKQQLQRANSISSTSASSSSQPHFQSPQFK